MKSAKPNIEGMMITSGTEIESKKTKEFLQLRTNAEAHWLKYSDWSSHNTWRIVFGHVLLLHIK